MLLYYDRTTEFIPHCLNSIASLLKPDGQIVLLHAKTTPDSTAFAFALSAPIDIWYCREFCSVSLAIDIDSS